MGGNQPLSNWTWGLHRRKLTSGTIRLDKAEEVSGPSGEVNVVLLTGHVVPVHLLDIFMPIS